MTHPTADSPVIPDGAAGDAAVAAPAYVAPTVHEVRATRRHHYFRAVWSGAALRVVNIVTQLLMVSLTVRYLGKERYGVWTIVNTLVAWFTLANLGLGHGLTARLAGLQDARHAEEARRAVLSAVALIAAVSALAAVPVIGISALVPWARLFNVTSSDAAADVLPTVLTGIAIVMTMLPLTLGPAILSGHQRADLANATSICGAVVGLALLFVAVKFRAGMPTLFAAVMLPQMAAMVAQFLVARRLGFLRFARHYFDRPEARHLLGLGWRFLVSQLFAIFIFEVNALIIARQFGAAEVTPYGVTYRLSMLVVAVFGVVMAPLVPAYGDAFARGDVDWARRATRRSMTAVLAIWAAAAVVLGVGGRTIIYVWAGPDAVPSWLLLWAMLLFTLAFGVTQVFVLPLNGTGRINAQLLAGAISAAANIPLALVLARYLGIPGVVITQAVLLVLVAIPLQARAYRGLLIERRAPQAQQIQ